MSDLHDDDLKTGDEGTEELSAEQLQEQLSKKEEDIQFLKGKWGEEKAELRKELETIKQQHNQFEGRISEQREMMSSKKEPAKDPYDFDEETIEKFQDNPVEIVNFFKERENNIRNEQAELVNLVVDALKEQKSEFQGSLSGIKKEIDPEIQAWKPAIQELQKNDKLANLDEQTLIEIAKMRDMKPLMDYRGAAGGQREREQQHKAKPFDPSSLAGSMLMKMFNNDRDKAEKTWKRAEAKKGLQ